MVSSKGSKPQQTGANSVSWGLPGAIDRVHRMMDSGALGYVQELPLAPVGKHESGAWMWL